MFVDPDPPSAPAGNMDCSAIWLRKPQTASAPRTDHEPLAPSSHDSTGPKTTRQVNRGIHDCDLQRPVHRLKARIVALPHLGGLHHHYDRRAADHGLARQAKLSHEMSFAPRSMCWPLDAPSAHQLVAAEESDSDSSRQNRHASCGVREAGGGFDDDGRTRRQ
jgi:hypothetical protein